MTENNVKNVVDTNILLYILQEKTEKRFPLGGIPGNDKIIDKILSNIVIVEKVFNETYQIISCISMKPLLAKQFLKVLGNLYSSCKPSKNLSEEDKKDFLNFQDELLRINYKDNLNYFTRKNKRYKGDEGDMEILFNYLKLVKKNPHNIYCFVTKDKKFIKKIYNSLQDKDLYNIFKRFNVHTFYRNFFEIETKRD